MAKLRERDLRAVLQLVGEAHDADDLPEYRRSVLAGLPRLIETDYIAYNEIDASSGVHVADVVPALEEHFYAKFDRLALQNPIVAHYTRTLDGRPYRFSDLVTRRELHALEIYREVYRPLGVEAQIALALPAPVGLTIGIALSRGLPDFTERDRDVLNLARPHLIQAYRNAKNRERLRAVLDALRRGLDDGAQSVIIVDGDRHIAFVSERARRDLAAIAGRDLAEDDPLPEPLSSWIASEPEAVPLVVEGGRPLTVRRLPGGRADPHVLFLTPGPPALSVGALRGLGLTPREAEVLHGIVLGRANGTIAQALGISPRTVHKHVEHIFDKLGVTSRVEAVATVWAALGDP